MKRDYKAGWLYNKYEFEDGDKGCYAKLCPECGYAIEDCAATANFTTCPICEKQGRAVRLQAVQVSTWPKHRVKRVHPLPELSGHTYG